MRIINNLRDNQNFYEDFNLDLIPQQYSHQSFNNQPMDYDDDVFTLVSDTNIDNGSENVPEPPQQSEQMEASFILTSLIKSTWDAIDSYNSAIVTLRSNPNNDAIVKILTNIVNQQNLNIGQLQTAIKSVAPNASTIDKGEDMAKVQISGGDLTGEVAHPHMAVQSYIPVMTQPVESPCLDTDTQCTIFDVDDSF